MAGLRRHSQVFGLVLLQLSPEPAHSPGCLLLCSNSLRFGSFHVQNGPGLYFYNCPKSLYTGITSHPVSEEAPTVLWDYLLRCGSYVTDSHELARPPRITSVVLSREHRWRLSVRS